MNNIFNELLELWSLWDNSNLQHNVICFSTIAYTLYILNDLITNEKYYKRPMICYMSNFTLQMTISPIIGCIIGKFAPITFPFILGISHYPLFVTKQPK